MVIVIAILFGMSNQESRDSCGSHGLDKDGEPLFDHTCDDCMLPEPHLDPPEL
jgi:hypothetical protein